MRALRWYELSFPAGLSQEQATSLVRSLTSRGRAGPLRSARPICFELAAAPDGFSWRLGLPAHEARSLAGRFEQWLPGVALVPAAARDLPEGVVVELRLRSQRRPLRAELQPEISRGLADVGQQLRAGERLVVRWTVGGWLPRSPVPTSAPGERGSGPRRLGELGVPALDGEARAEARRKQGEQLFACVGRIAAEAAADRRRRQLISRVLGVYQLLRVSGAGLVRRSLPSWWVRARLERAQVSPVDPPCVLRADELVAVLGWPVGLDGDVELPGVELDRARLLRPDRRVLRAPERKAAEDEPERVVAASAYPSAPGRLVLPPRQALSHLHVLGPTGTGKSTLLAHLLLQDITAGRGSVLVDPKGDLVDDVLARLPRAVLDQGQVVVLDPSDTAPVGLNPLAGGAEPVAVDGLVGVLRSLWASSWGPRLQDVLQAGLLTLAQEPGHSLVELPLLLTDAAFRRPLVARAVERDPVGLAGFWAWYDGLSPEAQGQVLAPVMNKLRAFTLRPDLRAVLGQSELRFGLGQVFAGSRTLLVRLPKGELGAEAAALLGSLVVHQVWQATLARSALPAGARRPVFVYLDEFQEVVRLPLDLGDALAQARGLGVGLTMSHQHLGQLEPSVRAAVLANAGSRVAFRLDNADGSVMAKRSGGRLRPEDFTELPAFGAYVDLMAGSSARGFASARSLPLGPALRSPERVRRANQQRWGVPRAETEQHLAELLQAPNTSAAADESTSFGVVPVEKDEPDHGGTP